MAQILKTKDMLVTCTLLLIFSVSCNGIDLKSSQSFTFDQPNSFIKLNPDWPLSRPRQISFKFRQYNKTLLPHTLLLYHSAFASTSNGTFNSSSNYEVYELSLENAKLKLIHTSSFGAEHETMTIGHALNKDRWHDVQLLIDPLAGVMSIELDDKLKEINLESLQNLRDYDNKTSVVYFGGMESNKVEWNRQYSYRRFVGCIKNIELQVQDGCINKCHSRNKCVFGGRCVNLYETTVCNCFQTGHQGTMCSDDAISILTMRGNSYISYKIYDWDDKVHSDTWFDESLLFYGGGERPVKNFISASLKGGKIRFTISFGDGTLMAEMGSGLTGDRWHTFTVVHHRDKIFLILDHERKEITVTGPSRHLLLDPLFYIGGVPDRVKKEDLILKNNFIGSLKEVYFDIVSILERLKNEDPEVDYHGVFPPEFGYIRIDNTPVTFPFKKSTIAIRQKEIDGIDISFDFKTTQANAILATASIVQEALDVDNWQLYLENGQVIFTLNLTSIVKTYTLLGGFSNITDDKWHNLHLKYHSNEVELRVDDVKKSKQFISGLRFARTIHVAGFISLPHLGFIGCMRQIYVEKQYVDVRTILNSGDYHGEVTLDNCQLVDPCKKPNQCEHGGKCLIEDEKVVCDCRGTALYKRTCEELYLVGYREQGVYMIDIDGNGPHPPAPVTCDINTTTGIIMTRVNHNMDEKEEVRGLNIRSFYFNITYRDFTPEMLQTLITHSKNCTQLLSYSCHKAPLAMRTLTWFQSSYGEGRLYSLGVDTIGSCPCGETKSCYNKTKLCNCDVADGMWHNDTVELHDPKFLGITKMYFVKPRLQSIDALGIMQLGPLKCIEMDTQQYVITFRTSDSYLEVPGWRTGDLAFSFRTSSKHAILLYQQSHIPNDYFRVLLINETELFFEYSVEGKRRQNQISSHKPLNTGEWQQVWVDYDPHHVRFTINMEYKMINLEKDEEFSPFDGPLYIGGAPEKFHSQSSVNSGFVGCFRGLVMNEEVVNINYYLTSRTRQVVGGCKPSCHPNPCKNNATCHEFWGSYTCECRNPLAHFGKLCEHNLNTNGITFVTGTANSVRLFVGKDPQKPPFLTADILLSIRTYAKSGLIFYAHDHFNNFVQLHIQNGDELAFTFNSQRELMICIVKFPELTRGQPVQIFIDREKEFTVVHANEHKTTIDKPLYLINVYRQNPWREGEDLELVKPPRPPVEAKPYLQYFIGGIFQESMETQMAGFVGCITGLRIGNHTVDLAKVVASNPGNKAFREGCEMKCDLKPCLNDGYCIEDWKINQRTCNCTYTSYIGNSCDDERSGTFHGKELIKYRFFPSSIYLTVELKLAFVTSETPSNSSILLFVNSKVDERNYIYVMLLTNGSLKFEEDDGTGKIIKLVADNKGGTFGDGQRHWIYYVRHDDHINIYVDGIEHSPDIKVFHHIVPESDPTRYGGGDRDVVMLGGIDFVDPRFANHINYTGCLSNIMVKIDDFNISPLETAFGYNAGRERLEIEGNLSQAKACTTNINSMLPTTQAPLNLTIYLGPEWKPPGLEKVEFLPPTAPSRYDFELVELTTRRVALGMGTFLLILIIAIGIYIWRLDWKDKQIRYEQEELIQNNKKKKAQMERNDAKIVRFQRRFNNNRTSGGMRFPYQEPEVVPLHVSSNAVAESSPTLIKRDSCQDLEWDPSGDDFVDSIPEPEPVEEENTNLPSNLSVEIPPPNPPSYEFATRSQPSSPLVLDGQYRSFGSPLNYLIGSNTPQHPFANYVNQRSSLKFR
uniref:EGF-like domain-containing protein n=1 Tax=Strigamia maritima TaxID=126957 RepID=T1JNX1_STRMM